MSLFYLEVHTRFFLKRQKVKQKNCLQLIPTWSPLGDLTGYALETKDNSVVAPGITRTSG